MQVSKVKAQKPDPSPCHSTSHTESIRSNIIEKTDGWGFTEKLPSSPSPWETYAMSWLKAPFCTDKATLTNRDTQQSWGLTESLRLPELPLLPCKMRVILNLAGFGDGTKEVFLWTVPATGSECIHVSSPRNSHPALNCFNLITPLSQIQIIEHHLRDYNWDKGLQT